MRSPQIRERFLNFFERRGHLRLPSASLVTHDDPTVLFTVAGMVPLQPYFRGTRTPPSPRVTSVQKCLRTVDIEEVGDSTHNTFFEMLGNFSFGDYFKEGAIALAWEFLTDEVGLDRDLLWPSVHPGDTAALALWTGMVGVPEERVSFLEDNFWGPAGPSGPCGYDSEIYFDRGGPCSCGRPDCRPDTECGGDRWVEIWNLVFPEFDQDESGDRRPLPQPGIDTGMGLERICMVLQGVPSIYDTDLFAALIADFRARSATGGAPGSTASFNVLADHLRSAAFLMADGVLPSNESRGYVLRRIIRRAAVHGRRVGLDGGLAGAVAPLLEAMGGAYPELVEHRALIEEHLRGEEAAFARTLAEGEERLQALLERGGAGIAGDDAFRLHDTYGFPIELTVELARERGADVDLGGFEAAMAEQRARSRARAAQGGFESAPQLPPTTFVGYDTLEVTADVVLLGDRAGAGRLAVGETAPVVVEPSPFYAEAGGQVGDRGELLWDGGRGEVLDTQYIPGTDVRALTVRVTEGVLDPGARVTARVDAARRAQTARHHSATHLLHRALRNVLGETVVQRGSLVGPDHTTFDFNFPRGLTAEELERVQHAVNDAIRRDLPRTATLMPIAEARATGAVALFGEKYGEEVRVIDFGGWSRELCGGTHVERSGELGGAIILTESSVGQGLRRIDMVVGEAAEQRWTSDLAVLRDIAQSLRARPEEVPERIAALQAQVRRLQRDVDEARRRAVTGSGAGTATVEDIDGLRLAHLTVDGDGGRDAVVAAVDGLFAERLQADGVALVLGPEAVAVKVGGRARHAGVHAGDLVRAAAAATGGRGGGRPDFANGGVGDPARRPQALEAVRAALRTRGTAA